MMKKLCNNKKRSPRPIVWAGMLWALFLALPLQGIGQDLKNYSSIEGIVVEKGDNKAPVEFATVQLLPSGMLTTTNAQGTFTFPRVASGKMNLIIHFLGMNTIDTSFVLTEGRKLELRLEMEASSFRLTEVTVVATENKAGSATASNISRQAMDHMQTSSIANLMQLLPGGVIENPDLSSSNYITLRTITPSSMNSLGTAIIVDGAPLSNNANLQALSPSIEGATGAVGGGASPSTGIDVRTISPDNIEAVEVIRGIPSAQYGDLTSGIVNIRSKAGKEPLNIRFKTNPQTYQVSAGKGMNLGGNAGSLNISADYAYNVTDPTESYAFYQRATVKALYSNRFWNIWSSNTSFDVAYGKDTRKLNPDDQRTQTASGAQDITFRLNTNGTININKRWLTNLQYVVSGSYADKHSFKEELLGNAFAPYATARTDGAVTSNKPGQKVYDIYGNEITRISPDDPSAYTTYLPNEYFQHYDIYGKEVNVFAKLTANFNKGFRKGNSRTLVGIDFQTDGNLGDGKVYDQATPPLRSSNANSSPRPRAYKDIPFVNQVGVYLEEIFSYNFGPRMLNVQIGGRYNNINGKDIITPRTNLSFDIIPRWFTLRGGYGIAAKAPTLLYLYPEQAYFDFVNYNTLNSSLVPEEEQLMVTTTKVFNTDNSNLKIATNEKIEVGFDMQFPNKMRLAVTGYNENLRNGYSMGYEIGNFVLAEYQTYKEGMNNPGAIPTLEEDQLNKLFIKYATPGNNARAHNRGVEFDMDFGRIHSIRTSFVLNGAYMRTTNWTDNYTYSEKSKLNELAYNVGVYEKAHTKSELERLVTTLRITHNIPKIGFAVTLTTQVKWMDKTFSTIGNDSTFTKYISCVDGNVYDWDPAMAQDPDYQYMLVNKDPKRHIGESYFPTVLFNIQLTKEIGDFLRASFFANNMFNSRPLYESKRTPGRYSRLNEYAKLYFGFELAISIK